MTASLGLEPATNPLPRPRADADEGGTLPAYVLITPARDEEAFIEKAIESVIHQTFLPLKWVIVDDGSTDKTSNIVGRYLLKYPWIELVRQQQRPDRTFASKVHAFNAGYERVETLDYEVLGNLDADLSFDADYIEFILRKFQEDDTLGVAGTAFKENGYSSDRHSFEGHHHVAGGCQLFRKRCFEDIGGFVPNEAGGVDWIAVTTARMKGWKTRSFREKFFFHQRRLGTADRRVLSSAFSYGEKDYCLGGHPVWELFRAAYQATNRPYLLAGLAVGAGYCWGSLRRAPLAVSRDLMAFHRQEQMEKLKAILKCAVRFKPVDSFLVLPD